VAPEVTLPMENAGQANINSADLVILYTTNPLYSSVRDMSRMSRKVIKFATVSSLAQNTESPLIWPPMV
jgi:formylmethanofuran dehydrogenase subunit B